MRKYRIIEVIGSKGNPIFQAQYLFTRWFLSDQYQPLKHRMSLEQWVGTKKEAQAQIDHDKKVRSTGTIIHESK